MGIAIAMLSLCWWIGKWWREWTLHRARLNQIKLRIHVSGTRGKSTVTRLIAGGLRQAGHITVAKTTGSAARFIYPDGSEAPWPRHGRPNIHEQVDVVKKANDLGAKAMVLECMALQPEITWVAERIFPANIAVITNVRPDHTDVFPLLENYARAMALIIPKNGWVITTPGPYAKLINDYAASRNSQVKQVIPTDQNIWGELGLLHHLENLALATAALELAGVPREIANAGMAKTPPDPGAFTIHHLLGPGGDYYLANVFAANDPVSTKELLQGLLPAPLGVTPVILYNHRTDRIQRARDFQSLLTQLVGEKIAVYSTGPAKPPFTADIPYLEQSEPETLLAELGPAPLLIIGIGNIDGMGHMLCNYFSKGGVQVWGLPS